MSRITVLGFILKEEEHLSATSFTFLVRWPNSEMQVQGKEC